jgi:NAD(P)H dehydrogenase (quinone)
MENKYLLILFYSAGGSVRNIAHAIADGAEECNLNVKIRTVPKVSSVSEQVKSEIPEKDEIYCTKDDLINCSGLALRLSYKVWINGLSFKIFLDSTGDLWASNALEDLPGIVFTSTGSMHGVKKSLSLIY